ncbi:MAG TPA: YtxH domain-containing protein [Chryseosolibacter sp.]|nr:YtxH domain-containing protein [Chryseosolibacter sp.]
MGVLVGAALGSIAALLLAPATGLRTRKNINKKAKKIVKQIEGMVYGKPKKRLSTASATSHAKNGRASVSSR